MDRKLTLEAIEKPNENGDMAITFETHMIGFTSLESIGLLQCAIDKIIKSIPEVNNSGGTQCK
jgi:hypothetical protein